MQIKKTFVTICAIMLVWCFCSCSPSGSDLMISVSPSNQSLMQLAITTYQASQLEDIVQFDGTINELNDIYPVECLRETNGMYRVSYLGEEKIAVIQFDSSGNKLWGTIYNCQKLKTDFAGLTVGDSIEKVQAIDPDGSYLFLYTGRIDTSRESLHYTKDGYLITIEYDDSCTVINIHEELA